MPGESDDEFGELTGGGVYLQAAAMLLHDDVVTDGEAEAGAFAGGLGGEEGIEDFGAYFRWDARAVVAEADLDGIAMIDGGDAQDGRVAGAELLELVVDGVAGVVEDVEEDAAEILGDAVELAGVGGELAFDGDVEGGILGAHAVVGEENGLLDHGVDVDDLAVAGAATGVEQHALDDAVGALAMFVDLACVAGEIVEEIFHVVDVGLATVADFGDFFTEFFHEFHGEFGEVVDEVEGVLDFVGDAGGESAEGSEFLLDDELILRGLDAFIGVGIIESDGGVGGEVLQ